jgi:uncharacterized protein YdhG (YjbR/CyaY superfamily)
MKVSAKKPSPYGSVKFSTIDEYHALFPLEVQKKLQQLRQLIKKAAPKATETISYNMPAFKQHKSIVYYAAYKHHIGFYPTASPLTVFKDELTTYKTSKGAIQFPIDKPLPVALIRRIVLFRVKEDAEMAKTKSIVKTK